MAITVGRFGVWLAGGRLDPALAVEIERLGYGAIWIGGSPGGDLALAESLLDATRTITVATGVVNVWATDASVTADAYHRIAARHGERFLLGLGIGHREGIATYQKPYATMTAYLDRLDDAGVPREGRVLAALGPRFLALAAERSAGAHPYLTVPAHTRIAREILGPDRLLAPEHKVFLGADPASTAQAARREFMKTPYLGLASYARNLRRLGFSEEDLADGGSDRLVDELVLHGDPGTVARGLRAHLDAGADHVAVHSLGAPLETYRALAVELF